MLTLYQHLDCTHLLKNKSFFYLGSNIFMQVQFVSVYNEFDQVDFRNDLDQIGFFVIRATYLVIQDPIKTIRAIIYRHGFFPFCVLDRFSFVLSDVRRGIKDGPESLNPSVIYNGIPDSRLIQQICQWNRDTVYKRSNAKKYSLIEDAIANEDDKNHECPSNELYSVVQNEQDRPNLMPSFAQIRRFTFALVSRSFVSWRIV